MTDDTDSSDSSPTDRSSTDEQSQVTDRAPPAWPPSNYAILVAILLVGGAGIALVASVRSTADLLATVAYYALVVGVSLRVVEYVAGERVRSAVSNRVRVVRRTVRVPAVGGRFAFATASPSVSSWRVLNEETERGLLLTVPLTVAGGAALLVRWWLDTGTVPNRFLAGWMLTLGALVGLYLLVERYNRRERERPDRD